MKNINFITAYKKYNRDKNKLGYYKVLLALLPIGIILGLTYDYGVHKQLLSEYKHMVWEEENLSKESGYSKEAMETLRKQVLELEEHNKMLEAIPRTHKQAMNQIMIQMNGKVQLSADGENIIEYHDNVLQISGVTGDYREIPGYIERLEKTGIFTDVAYEGFKRRDEEYYFQIKCLLGVNK